MWRPRLLDDAPKFSAAMTGATDACTDQAESRQQG
jgi:hypothetical protein